MCRRFDSVPRHQAGGVAKWLNAAVCKTALSEFGGSNPPSSIIGISYNGSTSVSKTADVGSIPTIPVYLHGGIGEGVNTPVCGSGMRGFESHIPPHNGGLAQLGEHLPYKQEVTGSSPVSSIFFYPKTLDDDLSSVFILKLRGV